MKSETGIAQFSVCGSYVVRRSRTAEAKLLLEFLNCKPTLIRIGHVVSCSVNDLGLTCASQDADREA
jgi:hypothetical protein